MSDGVKALRRIQLGKELVSAPGDAVAATAIYRGMGTIDDQTEIVFPDEQVGILGGDDRSYIPKLAAAISWDEVEATFEQIMYVLEAGVKEVTTAASDTSGSGKIYAYPFPTTAIQTRSTFTIEGGDNAGAEEMEYAFVESFVISGTSEEGVMISAEWIGRQAVPTSFTGGKSIPTVEEIVFGKCSIYIDTAGGTIGVTTAGNTLFDFSLNVKTGVIAKFNADGELFFSRTGMNVPEVDLDLTYEHNTTSIAEKAAYRAQETRQIRLLITGSDLATAGSSYSTKALVIDVAGKYQDWDKIGDKDGNDTVSCKLISKYNSTAALFAEITVVNEVAVLP